MNRALIRVVRAGFLASTILASPAFADMVTGLSPPENQGRTIRSVPQGINVTIIGSGALRMHQLSSWVTGAARGITSVAYTLTIDAEKLQADIATLRNNGTPAGTIEYIFSLDGITIPDEVLSGGKSVREAIVDGSLTQGGAPTAWTPPIMQPSPIPDLTPRGSSAADWSSNATVPTLEQLRQSDMSRSRPPSC